MRAIVGDVHGHLKTLEALLLKLHSGCSVTLVGDLIDRGPDSRGVIELVRSRGYDCVLGNHEQMMLDELKLEGKHTLPTGIFGSDWAYNGGVDCLASYQKADRTYDFEALTKDLAWLRTLPVYIEYPEEDLIVSHSSCTRAFLTHPPESEEFKLEVLWNRDPSPPKFKEYYNIFGHTPQKTGIKPQNHFACVDSGVYLRRPNTEYGKLTALIWPTLEIIQQENIDEES